MFLQHCPIAIDYQTHPQNPKPNPQKVFWTVSGSNLLTYHLLLQEIWLPVYSRFNLPSSLSQSVSQSVTQSLTHARTCACTRARTHALTHSRIHSIVHWPTHNIPRATEIFSPKLTQQIWNKNSCSLMCLTMYARPCITNVGRTWNK